MSIVEVCPNMKNEKSMFFKISSSLDIYDNKIELMIENDKQIKFLIKYIDFIVINETYKIGSNFGLETRRSWIINPRPKFVTLMLPHYKALIVDCKEV